MFVLLELGGSILTLQYLLLWYRKLCISIHVVSGTCEIISFVTAFFLETPAIAVVVACILDLLHSVTALLMTPNVFGVQAIMHVSPDHF